MYRAHFIEFKEEYRKPAYKILAKHLENGDIDDFRIYEDTVHGMKRIGFKLHLYVSDDLEIIKNEFREEGIELF